jgi:trehalose-phosphatase
MIMKEVSLTKSKNDRTVNHHSIKAVIVHMDGVITQTTLHCARAWKMMFDAFLQSGQYSKRLLKPLDINEDYIRYFNSQLPQDGIRNFLESRNIFLLQGSPQDSPEKDTLFGLVNRHNRIFLEIINEEGIEIFGDTIDYINKQRAIGLKTAVITSEINGACILEKAGVRHLFDTCIDGIQPDPLQLPGKSAQDIYLQAARQLGVEPEHAMVIAADISGVQTGSRGKFGAVVGVARSTSAESLLDNGADIVVNTLSELQIERKELAVPPEHAYLPSSLMNLQLMQAKPLNKNIVVFLDYDGTLAPVVSQPEEAVMSDEMRELVKELASVCRVAVVSGRDRADVERMVGLPELIYAGSHGFDISGPDIRMEHEEGKLYLPDLDTAQQEIQHRIGEIAGALIERKKYAIAVHYRNVAENQVIPLLEFVYQMCNNTERLELGLGKMMVELRPAVDWHKGKAIAWLMETLNISHSDVLPIYIGADLSDEDAFRFLNNTGIGILVGNQVTHTEASYQLADISQVKQLLFILINFLKR